MLNVNELCTPNKSIYVKLKKKKSKVLIFAKRNFRNTENWNLLSTAEKEAAGGIECCCTG